MTGDNFSYDLAISFVAQDEPLAVQLADQLEGRMTVFLYSRKQEQLGGTDGEKTFNDVFAKQSRLVVILYRENWGVTPWTRIEETAIRNRGFEEGYDFALFIPLDDKPSVPQWLPKNRLWIGLNRWGVSGAASVIDARLQELGGTPLQESLEQRAARLDKEINFSKFRERYLSTDLGVRNANAAYDVLINEIESRVPGIQASITTFGISLRRENTNFSILGSNCPSLKISWNLRYINTLNESNLELSIWPCHPPLPGQYYYDFPSPSRQKKLLPDVFPLEEACWVVQGSREKESMLPEVAAEYILNWWLDFSIDQQRKSR